ncbi:YTH domain-containing protein 1, partial [Reticulomyxa filosa]
MNVYKGQIEFTMHELEQICDNIFTLCSGIRDNALLLKMFGQMSQGKQVDIGRVESQLGSETSSRGPPPLESFRSVSNFGRLGSISTDFIDELLVDEKTPSEKSKSKLQKIDEASLESNPFSPTAGQGTTNPKIESNATQSTSEKVEPPTLTASATEKVQLEEEEEEKKEEKGNEEENKDNDDNEDYENDAELALDLEALDGDSGFWNELIDSLCTKLSPKGGASVPNGFGTESSGDREAAPPMARRESLLKLPRQRSSLLMSMDPQVINQKKLLQVSHDGMSSKDSSKDEMRLSLDLSPIGFQSLVHASYVAKTSSEEIMNEDNEDLLSMISLSSEFINDFNQDSIMDRRGLSRETTSSVPLPSTFLRLFENILIGKHKKLQHEGMDYFAVLLLVWMIRQSETSHIVRPEVYYHFEKALPSELVIDAHLSKDAVKELKTTIDLKEINKQSKEDDGPKKLGFIQGLKGRGQSSSILNRWGRKLGFKGSRPTRPKRQNTTKKN